jgi:pimeloyl-ACP methyl ester carboxylesterase
MKTKQAIQTASGLSVSAIEVNGTNLNYIEKGSGEAVVFIHGAVSDLRTWLDQIEAFSENYRAISYSRRYYEPNEKASETAEYSRELHTTDLIEFLKRLGLEKAHLVGHSYGASVALMAALKNPELVASLTLGEPSPFSTLLSETELSLLNEQKTAFGKAMRLAENGNKESAVREFLHTVVGVDVLPLLPEERRAVVLENQDTLLPMLRTYYDLPPVNFEKLKFLNIPTLIITGELSPKISRVTNEAINKCLPDSRVKILKCASHGLQIENPAGFNQLVLEFLLLGKNKI